MIRRIERWMRENGVTWNDIALLLVSDKLKLESARRKLKRLRNLTSKPCSCLLMDMIEKAGIPAHLIMDNETF